MRWIVSCRLSLVCGNTRGADRLRTANRVSFNFASSNRAFFLLVDGINNGLQAYPLSFLSYLFGCIFFQTNYFGF